MGNRQTQLDLAQKIKDAIGLKNLQQLNLILNSEKDSLLYTYAGVLLANESLNDEAVDCFKRAGNYGISKHLKEYLQKNGTLNSDFNVFNSSEPYDVWMLTNFLKTYRENTTKACGDYFSKNSILGKEISILDLGTGNGYLIADIINSINSQANYSKIDLVLVDKSEEMLLKAKSYCLNNIKCKNLSITTEQIELNLKTFGKLLEQYEKIPFDIVNCALSIHHLPHEVKLPLLKFLRPISENIVISECNWSHDIPETGSFELIKNVSENYGCIFDDLRKSCLSEKDIECFISGIGLPEALKILTKPRMERIDYHTTIEHWSELAEKADWHVSKVVPTVIYNEKTESFTMFLN